MALLSQGDADQTRVSCPACGTVLRASDVHSPAALAATSKASLPPHLRAAVLEVERGGGEGGEVAPGHTSSKIRRLMEVRAAPCMRTAWLLTQRGATETARCHSPAPEAGCCGARGVFRTEDLMTSCACGSRGRPCVCGRRCLRQLFGHCIGDFTEMQAEQPWR